MGVGGVKAAGDVHVVTDVDSVLAVVDNVLERPQRLDDLQKRYDDRW